MKDWKEFFERVRAKTVYLRCFENGHDWKRTIYRLPPELAQKAKDLDLDISKITENALREYIRRLEGVSSQTMANGGLVDARSASCSATEWTGD